MLNQVQTYIYEALNNKVNAIRSQAESQLFQLANENTTEFFLTLANIISNDSKDPMARQSTGTVFSRFVTFNCDKNHVYWDLVHQETKPKIKELLLSTLMQTTISIMKTGANTIAHIASIQIPRREWLDIVNILAQNAQHDDYNIRMASVITLGYICQELKNCKQVIDNESCQQILGGLLMSLQKEGQIVQIALNALRDSIQFLRLILQNQTYCNKTFQFVLPLLEHPQIRQKVYQILYQFCKHCYHLVDNYLSVIIQFTLAHIQLRNQDSINALTLWETIGTQYLQRRGDINDRLNQKSLYTLQNLIVVSHQKILPQVMGCILIVNSRDYQFPELREEAVNTLSVMVQCGNREMVEIITEGVSKILQSSNPGERQASCLLFSCLCNYEDRDDILNRFHSGFTHLFKLLQDPEQLVLKNSLSGFVTLSETFPQVFLTNPEIREIVFHLLNLAGSPNEDISILSLTIICNLTECLPKYPDPIASDPKDIITQAVKMFTNGLKSQINKQANQKLIVLMMNIIMSTSNQSIINQLITYLITLYHQYASINIKDKEIILENIVTVLHTCLLAVSKFPLPKIEYKTQIYQLIDQHIRINGVEQEGINLISAASACFKKDFKYKMDSYWGKIMQGLSLIDQKLTFKASLTCISDIARNHQSQVVDKISKVFQILVSYMHDNIDRQLKTDILKCFGDLTLGLKRYCQKFVETLLEISQNCINAVYNFSQIQTEKAYAQQLKEALIQMYHCLVFAVNDQQRCNNKMAAHFPNICTFIVKSCDVKYKPTVDYLKSCMYLICDSALFYSKNAYYSNLVANVVESRQIGNLLQILQKYKEGRPDVKEILIFAQDKLRRR